MVRTTTRRTRTDLEYLADVADSPMSNESVVEGADDGPRNTRLISHGWLTAQGRVTADGASLAATVDVLRRRDVFDCTVDTVGGLPAFVDIATACPPGDVVAYLAGVRTLASLVDDARHDADTRDDEYDHDGTFAPHFADFDPRAGTVELRFKAEATATAFRDEWTPDRMQANYTHDDRFDDGHNPRRLVVADVV
jgi:hypothetical protein